MQTPIEHLTDQSGEPVPARPALTVIDFWGAGCRQCRMMAPQFENAATRRPRYRFAKLEVDAAPRLAARSGIRSIPTLAVARDGKPVAMQAGVMSAEQLVQALDRLGGGVPPASAEAAA